MLGSLTFLSPEAGMVALAVVLPLTAYVLMERRLAYARRLLRLAAPRGGEARTIVASLAAVPLLLGVAAAQPAVRTQHGTRVRTDAEAFFVLDISRSMLAAPKPRAQSRLARARRAAVQLRSDLAEIPSGVATLTDRVLPDLFPTGDPAAFGSTVAHVAIEQPPPQSVEVNATTLAPLADVGTQGYFTPAVRHRLLVVLTDGESRAFSEASVARALRTGPGVALVLIHVAASDERVFRPSGGAESYRPDPQSRSVLESLATASDGRVFGEADVGAAAAFARSKLGTGPTAARSRERRTTPLAPYVAGAAVLPLLLVLLRRNVARN